ncbi:hypothetical protein ASPCAL10357 [Aspergillus calidoustus]|uniref:Uncharacterized protein n=1 Tax=Aspergillus calidoustus TaxID=454130 RepID=A0A0U5CC26_ASPCI|nr:hypothetical protein ASPCAL10357 [Aspergillus calidoustus]
MTRSSPSIPGLTKGGIIKALYSLGHANKALLSPIKLNKLVSPALKPSHMESAASRLRILFPLAPLEFARLRTRPMSPRQTRGVMTGWRSNGFVSATPDDFYKSFSALGAFTGDSEYTWRLFGLPQFGKIPVRYAGSKPHCEQTSLYILRYGQRNKVQSPEG